MTTPHTTHPDPRLAQLAGLSPEECADLIERGGDAVMLQRQLRRAMEAGLMTRQAYLERFRALDGAVGVRCGVVGCAGIAVLWDRAGVWCAACALGRRP
jgi:hypothetical protein